MVRAARMHADTYGDEAGVEKGDIGSSVISIGGSITYLLTATRALIMYTCGM